MKRSPIHPIGYEPRKPFIKDWHTAGAREQRNTIWLGWAVVVSGGVTAALAIWALVVPV